jgi:nucleoside-diphosphate-sugar epimerase
VVAAPPSEIAADQLSPHPHDFSHHLAIDTSRIRAELGYREIVPREEGLRRTIEWERAQRAAVPTCS